MKRVKRKRKGIRRKGGRRKQTGNALRRWRKRNNYAREDKFKIKDCHEMRSDDDEYDVDADNIGNDEVDDLTSDDNESTTLDPEAKI